MRNKGFFNIIGIVFFCYILIYSISFLFFSNVSVDTVIGMGVISLFYCIYYLGQKQISNLLLNQSKKMYILFGKMIYLVVMIKKFLISLNESYFNFLWYKFNGLRLSSICIDFLELKLSLVRSFNINKLYNLFSLKLSILEKFFKTYFVKNFINNNYYVVFNNYNCLNYFLILKF